MNLHAKIRLLVLIYLLELRVRRVMMQTGGLKCLLVVQEELTFLLRLAVGALCLAVVWPRWVLT